MLAAGRRHGQNWSFKEVCGERIAAVLLACALHLGVASLMWNNISRHNSHDLSYSEPISVEFVLLPPQDEVQRPTRPSNEPNRGNDESPQADLPVTAAASEHHLSRRRPASPRSRPERVAVSPSTSAAANSDTAPLAHDFAWRPSDSAAPAERHARHQPTPRLSPKERHAPSPLAREMKKAARPPCRDAYAAQGLLALPFLLTDAVLDKGCTW